MRVAFHGLPRRLFPLLIALGAMGCPVQFVGVDQECAADAECSPDETCDAESARCIEDVTSVEPGVSPGVEPGVSPSVEPGVEPGVSPGVEPGVSPGVEPGVSPGVEPGVSPGVEPDALDAGIGGDGGPGDDAGRTDAGDVADGGADAGNVDAGNFEGDGGGCIDNDSDGHGIGCALGPDCNDDDSGVFTLASLFVDDDEDTYTIGNAVSVCVGTFHVAGYQSVRSATDDCDDEDGDAYVDVFGYLDADNDTYTAGPGVRFCGDGILPAGYVGAPSVVEDCADDNDTVFNSGVVFVDNDRDERTVGNGFDICYGTDLPLGFHFERSATDDCNDSDATIFEFVTGFRDFDNDTVTVGGPQQVCSNGTVPSPYRAARSPDDDCNDVDETVFAAALLFRDQDNDTVTVGDAVVVCAGLNPPSGYEETQSPLDDCDDTNESIGTSVDTDGDFVPDCLDADDDNDGLTDVVELAGIPLGFPTDPLVVDTDGDGTNDGADAAPTEAACSSSVLFSDAFSTDPFGVWIPAVADHWQWNAGTGRFVNGSPVAGAAAWIGPQPSWTDYVVSATITPLGAGGDPGITFRAQEISSQNNQGHHYYVGIRPSADEVVFGIFNDGYSERQTTPFTITPGASYRLRVELSGDAIRIFVDGTQVMNRNETLYDFGSVGVRSYFNNVEYDDMIVCQ